MLGNLDLALLADSSSMGTLLAALASDKDAAAAFNKALADAGLDVAIMSPKGPPTP